jgi:hypothetical protein
MSLTVLLYKDTPFDHTTKEELLEHLLMVKFCKDKEFSGAAICSAMCHKNPDGTEVANYPHGYLIQINDEVHHTDDLWVICLDVKDPERKMATQVTGDIIYTTECSLADGYMMNDNIVLQFNGGAPYYRAASAVGRRGYLQAV